MEEKKLATIYDLRRVCTAQFTCMTCPLHGLGCDMTGHMANEEMNKLNDAIIKWCEEHPAKTRQSEFLKMFPDAKLSGDGIINICPDNVEYTKYKHCPTDSDGKAMVCKDCIKKYWSEEIE